MVRYGLLAAGISLALHPAWAESPANQLFPGKSGCYARNYSDAHLSSHPDQLVTAISVKADASIADPMLGLLVFVDLRGDIAGSYLEMAYCESTGDHLTCYIEGDAGSFTLASAKNGGIMIEAGPYGMSFEGADGYITLMSDRGDDRSFLLEPVGCG